MSGAAVRLVVSDVDGTLVQPDKSLSAGTVAAARRLQEAGVPLAIVSARPPRGMRFLAEELGLRAPFAGFNGGATVRLDGTVVAWQPTPADLVRDALDLFRRHGVDPWLFTRDEWLILPTERNPLDGEIHTVRFEPRTVDSFDPFLDQVGKLVGVSHDHVLLERVERELQAMVGARASAHRSQKYYLDLTHADANKGHAVLALAEAAGVRPEEVAVIGDMVNDVPMFRVAGFSVCMGNGSDEAKAEADAVTSANDQDGWARAIDELILPRAAVATVPA